VAEAEFFLEYDTGTEDLPRLAAKLTGYQRLAVRTAITTPVLFWLHSPRSAADEQQRASGSDLVTAVEGDPECHGEALVEGTAGGTGVHAHQRHALYVQVMTTAHSIKERSRHLALRYGAPVGGKCPPMTMPIWSKSIL
jgi:hypothetical protein